MAPSSASVEEMSAATPPVASPTATPPVAAPDTTPPAAAPDTTPPAAAPGTTPPAAAPGTTPPAAAPGTTPPAAAPDDSAPASPPAVSLPLEAPRMANSVFPSWDAFFAHFAAYQRETFQMYSSKSSTSVATRNHRIIEAQTEKTPTTDGTTAESDNFSTRAARRLPLVPAEVGVYAKTLACTHGGKPRSRGQGIRPRQQFRSMHCPAKINLVVKKIAGRDGRDPEAWQVVVTKHVVTHNHTLDAKTFMNYPQNRRVNDPQVLETVDALRRAGVKQRVIRAYLAERPSYKFVTKSDVHNLLAKMKNTNQTTASARGRGSASTGAGGIGRTMQNSETAALSHRGDSLGNGWPIGSLVPIAANGVVPSVLGNNMVNVRSDSTGTPSAGNVDAIMLSNPSAVTGGGIVAPPGVLPNPNATVHVDRHSGLSAMLTAAEESRSGSFRLRAQRLEEQNLSLYEQNMRLREHNQSQLTQLRDASARATALIALEAAAQEQIAVLKARVAELEAQQIRWDQHDHAQSQRSPLPSESSAPLHNPGAASSPRTHVHEDSAVVAAQAIDHSPTNTSEMSDPSDH